MQRTDEWRRMANRNYGVCDNIEGIGGKSMCHHKHLTLQEREDIMMMRRDRKSVTEIGRDKSTVSRELRRNSCAKGQPNEYYRAYGKALQY